MRESEIDKEREKEYEREREQLSTSEVRGLRQERATGDRHTHRHTHRQTD